MAALTANRPFPSLCQWMPDGGVDLDLLMTASQTIYEGAFVGFAAGTGTVAPVANGTTSVFAGIAKKKVVSAASGSYYVPVRVLGVFVHALAAVATADIGKVAFATDDNTLSLTSTNATAVGRIINVPSTGTCIIAMKMTGEVSGAVGTTYSASGL